MLTDWQLRAENGKAHMRKSDALFKIMKPETQIEAKTNMDTFLPTALNPSHGLRPPYILSNVRLYLATKTGQQLEVSYVLNQISQIKIY